MRLPNWATSMMIWMESLYPAIIITLTILTQFSKFCDGQYYPVDRLEGVKVVHRGSDRGSADDYSDIFSESGSHLAPVKIGPYRPWSFPPDLGKKISVSDSSSIYKQSSGYHPGYHTNIIIDPYAKDKSIVEIRTEDLSTGLTVGQTSWSGPGTLTLSALSSFLGGAGVMLKNGEENSVVRQSKKFPFIKRKKDIIPSPQTPSSSNTDAEWVPSLTASKPYESLQKAPAYEPHPSLRVLGKPCRSDYECSPALNSICGYNSFCKVTTDSGCYQYTCQCPPGTQPITNRYFPTSSTSSRHSRSLRYHQECKKIRR